MTRDEWTHTDATIFGYPCIKHKITKELTISGKAGDIWQYSDTELRMVLKPGGLRSRVLKSLGIKNRIDARSEQVVRFDPTLLGMVIEAAKISLAPAEQIFWANRFSE